MRKNTELRTLYEDPDIIALVKSKRLMWLCNGWADRPDVGQYHSEDQGCDGYIKFWETWADLVLN